MSDETMTAAEPGAAAPPPERRSSSGGLLGLLVALVIGVALAIWGLPMIAPHLPAPVAAFLTPGGSATDARLGALDERVATVNQVAETALAAVSGLTDRLAEIDQRLTALAEQPAATDPAAAERIASLESAIDALRGDLENAASQGVDGAAIADLRQQIAALSAAGGGGVSPDVANRLSALESAHQENVAARERAFAEAAEARRAAVIGSALAAVDRAMTLGLPFQDALDALAEAGATAPEPLAAVAAEGPWTREALKVAFAGAAHDAIEADLAAEAEGRGGAAAVLARFRARVTGLPTEAAPGDSAPAVLSRARIDLLKGDLDAALAAIKALPAPAQAAMAEWTAAAEKRAAADAALAAWRAELKMTL